MEPIRSIALPLIGLYMMISSNALLELYSCDLQKLVRENMFAKHTIAFILLFFLVILSDSGNKSRSLQVNFAYAILVYVMFIVTTKATLGFTLCTLGLLMVMFCMEQFKESIVDDERTSKHTPYLLSSTTYDRIQTVLGFSVFVISLIGLGYYYKRETIEYANSFNMKKFVFGIPRCSSLA